MAHTHAHDTTPITAAIIIVSDRSSRGERADASGPHAVEILTAQGYDVAAATIVPDGIESVRQAIQSAIDSGARLVITSGGTGVSARDLTPEGTLPLLAIQLPGIPEALRREGEKQSKMAVISRGLAGIARASRFQAASESAGQAAAADSAGHTAAATTQALVVNLPGSERAVAQGLEVLLPLVPHILDQLAGGDH